MLKGKLKHSTLMHLARCLESSESMDLWLLKGFAAIEQHICIWRLHKTVLNLSDRRVVKKVPGPGQGVAAQSHVVTDVQITNMILENERLHLHTQRQELLTIIIIWFNVLIFQHPTLLMLLCSHNERKKSNLHALVHFSYCDRIKKGD